ncbi:MAG TPA: TIGR01777 family oxidoreductase [Pyrinomonadaceae bacterium]|nr:TIGR01777 family oxidoreductase [Pyrinomonadaceae bacterium]HMP64368.1 TIGR01777 family oxidoreductase [Pyrinomonadaceae bacterium]
MKIVIPGGSGQVGTALARAFHTDGHDIVILSRRKGDTPWRTAIWDGKTLGTWAKEIDGADVVINLAGRSVNCRYNTENRRQMMDSRVDSTRVVGEAIAAAASPPKVWLQSSTATIYAHTFDHPNDDVTGVIGGNEPDAPDTWNFSIDVATAWERVTNEAKTPKTRKVLMRSAMIMGPARGGIFDTMLGIVRFGLGGTAASGKQYISWIHENDFIRSVYWLIEHEELSGPINIASPNPLPNKEFMRIFREAWGTRIGLPAFEWQLAIGAFFMRSETELILKSRRVIPKLLTDSGFTFDFPEWKNAATDLCQRIRKLR